MEHTTDWPSVIMSLFILCVGSLGIYFLLQKDKRSSDIIVFLPRQDIPTFTQIQDDSLFYSVRINAEQAFSDMVLDPKALIGAYLVEPVKANTIIRKPHIVVPPSEMLAYQTRVVSIQVPPAAAWHGEMAPGELVSVLIQHQMSGENEKPTPLLPKALVLKAQKAEPITAKFNGRSFFVTMVVPDEHFREIVISALSGSIMFVPNQG